MKYEIMVITHVMLIPHNVYTPIFRQYISGGGGEREREEKGSIVKPRHFGMPLI
jgi:hypothetical protein